MHQPCVMHCGYIACMETADGLAFPVQLSQSDRLEASADGHSCGKSTCTRLQLLLWLCMQVA